ncbi:16S rRNA (adenine(1518)-N(6)/adenine(1519)-N(6))-dimethyltransferase RsmA [Helicobacter burdigaliensis]|uniref:16S rRNA (adenine(1518)-N(6)/adenine(1519)-N(6))- dimethyltransferase RsmA n=1 Tax=Helicobacter burdigaliensis TaxID=2315334 RepID=UPI000EF6E7F2|nr:16S rRNA (adenine(1518)-N(6)/adenine(1519)-N(6))-dimethyltransferase RsmA [Helicobacter burdigaliensis]
MKETNKKALAKKQFGQNFLQDKFVLDKIIQSIPNTNAQIVEIGAGLGDLTNKLLSLGDITAYEVDTELLPYLEERFAKELQNGKLKIQMGDILKIWEGKSFRDKPYFLVSNLPYYIATLLVVKAIKDPLCKGFVVMTQKEVALKFCAKVKESDFSALSVLLGSVGGGELILEVPKEAFIPPPKVTSAVFRCQKTENCDFVFLQNLEKLLQIAFCAPRKTLLNNLQKHFEKEKILNAFLELEIEINSRPHEIDIPLYHRLLKIF